MKGAIKRKIAASNPPTKVKKIHQTKLVEKNSKTNGLGIFPHPEIHIACWNINGIRAWIKKPGVLRVAERPELDIICFNETKLQDSHVTELKQKFPSYPFQY